MARVVPDLGAIGANVRSRLCDLLNGALRGAFARESWTLSQSYYFGNVNGVHFRCEVIEGEPIDVCSFDGIEPIAPVEVSRRLSSGGLNLGLSRVGELLAAIEGGAGWHNSVRDKVAQFVSRGLTREDVRLIAPAITLEGYTVEQTIGELDDFYDSASRKGYGPIDAALEATASPWRPLSSYRERDVDFLWDGRFLPVG